MDAAPADATVRAVGGLWSVLENGTSAHEVAAARRKAVSTPYGPRKRVQVRGRPPMGTWTRTILTATPAVAQATTAALQRLGG